MPILYSPPDALDAETFARAGAQDPKFRNAQLALQNQGQLLQAQGDFFRTAIASGEQRARAGTAAAEMEARRFEFMEQQAQRGQIASLQARTELEAIDRRGQVQAFLQTLDPGYAEEQQYQRDLAELSRIQTDPQLMPFEKEQRIAELAPGIKMTQQRLMQSRAKEQEEQAKRESEQAKRMAAMEKEADEFNALAPEKRAHQLPDGSWLVRTGPRDWKHEPAVKPQEQQDNFGRTPKDWQSAMNESIKEIDQWRSERLKPPGAMTPDKRDTWTPPEDLTPEQVQENINRAMQRRGFAPTVQGHFSQQQTPGGAAVPTPQGGQQQPPPSPPPPPRPFSLESREKMDPAQKEITKSFYATTKEIEKLPDGPDKLDIAADMRRVGRIVEKYGRAPMPGEADFEMYTIIKKAIARRLQTGGDAEQFGRMNALAGQIKSAGR